LFTSLSFPIERYSSCCLSDKAANGRSNTLSKLSRFLEPLWFPISLSSIAVCRSLFITPQQDSIHWQVINSFWTSLASFRPNADVNGVRQLGNAAFTGLLADHLLQCLSDFTPLVVRQA